MQGKNYKKEKWPLGVFVHETCPVKIGVLQPGYSTPNEAR